MFLMVIKDFSLDLSRAQKNKFRYNIVKYDGSKIHVLQSSSQNNNLELKAAQNRCLLEIAMFGSDTMLDIVGPSDLG